MLKKLSLALACFSLGLLSALHGQTIRDLTNRPGEIVGVSFLLTDGTVMAHAPASHWWKLTPDLSGSYLNGTWKRLADLPSGYGPGGFAGAVLADGRLVIVGGESNLGAFALTNKGAIYDPVADVWTALDAPPGWDFIGEPPSTVLPDGRFLIGNKLDTRMATLDPATLTWTEVGSTGKADFHAEEGWNLLPDGTILTVDVEHAHFAERYLPERGGWLPAGQTVVNLASPSSFGCLPYGDHGEFCYYPPGEVGTAVLLPDGTVFATGSDTLTSKGHTAIYTPPTVRTQTGTWTAGPDFPDVDNGNDTFAVLLRNGHVLVQGLVTGKLYEFDGTQLVPELMPHGFSLLPLPTGEVFVSGPGVQIYTSADNTFLSGWAPKITTYPAVVRRGLTYKIDGQQFNGLSQASSEGDDLQNATNYPLVRITNDCSGHVFYARTHDHSTMAVATGNATVSTFFDVPAAMKSGTGTLEVVANGIPSVPVKITVK